MVRKKVGLFERPACSKSVSDGLTLDWMPGVSHALLTTFYSVFLIGGCVEAGLVVELNCQEICNGGKPSVVSCPLHAWELCFSLNTLLYIG